MTYKKPLEECYSILKGEDNINYILCVCDSTSTDAETSVGGQAWNINTDKTDSETSPDFPTMVGNMIECYLEKNGYSYTDKLSFIRRLSNEVIEHITNGEE